MILDRLTVVVPDGLGAREVPSLTFDWPWGSDVTLRFRLVHSDGSAYDLSGAVAIVLTFKRRATDVTPTLSREFVVTSAVFGEFEFHVSRNDRAKLVVGRHAVGMVLEDDDTETVDFVMVDSTLTVTDPIADVADPITALPADEPLARGPSALIFVVSRTISQPADGTDFFVSLPIAVPVAYSPLPVQVGGDFTLFKLPRGSGDRSAGAFRVQTLGALADGTVVDFFVFRTGDLS